MGLFHSSPASNNEEQHSLGPHGPSLAPRRGRRLNWWEVLKLGAVTVSVGALQVLMSYKIASGSSLLSFLSWHALIIITCTSKSAARALSLSLFA